MKGESWEMDPETRDYVQEGGSPVIDTTLKSPMYFRLLVPRTRWLYSPDAKYGSDYWTQKTRNDLSRPGILEGIGKRALTPLVDDERATEVEVLVEEKGRSYTVLTAKSIDALGNVEEITISPIGKG